MTSFVFGRYLQLIAPQPDSYCVGTTSSNTSRTSPVVAFAIRNFSCLWSLEVERKATSVPSGFQSISSKVPLLEISSLREALCGSGGILNMITFASSTLITQREIIGISLSPGKGYFHDRKVG